jgi:carboxylesterase type B
MTDRSFRMPATRLAEARAGAAAGTYCYEFRWKSPAYRGNLGAFHGVDLLFAFGNLAAARKGRVHRTASDPLADRMNGALVDFVRTGEPGWPGYRPASRPVMIFDTVSAVEEDPAALPRSLWQRPPAAQQMTEAP